MKKFVLLLAVLCVSLLPAFSLADGATPLPFDLTFDMAWDQVLECLGPDADAVPYDDTEYGAEVGSICLYDVQLTQPAVTADSLYVDVMRNNSRRESRINSIDLYLPVGDNCIADFRAALASLKEVYGEPDDDPFSAAAVADYVEYGGLTASWHFEDCAVTLSLNRSYEDSLSLFYAPRLNYDPADLQE